VGTDVHPTQTWVQGLPLQGMRRGSAIAAIKNNDNTFVHYQSDTGEIWQVVITGAAESATSSTPIKVGTGKALMGTKLTAVVLNTNFKGLEIHVFAQMEDLTIKDFIRTIDGGEWAEKIVPIGS
jgi:hypothetical protein